MKEVDSRRISEELNDLCEENHKKYRFVAIDTYDGEWDDKEDTYTSWIVKVIE